MAKPHIYFSEKNLTQNLRVFGAALNALANLKS